MGLRVRTLAWFPLACCMAWLLAGCGEADSPEQQVRAFVAAGRTAAEARSLDGIAELVSRDYGDEAGRDRRTLLRLTVGYFLRNKNIHLFTRIHELRFPGAERAELELLVAMAGQPVMDAEALLDIRADLYRFDFTLLREDGEWRLGNATWRRAGMDDFL